MKDPSELKSLSWESEKVKKLQKLKKKVLKKFKINTTKTQGDLTRCVVYLYIFKREQEVKEIVEFVLRINEDEIYKSKTDWLYRFYPQYLQIDPDLQDPEMINECINRIKQYGSAHPHYFKDVREDMKTQTEPIFVENNNYVLFTIAALELALGDESNFEHDFLRRTLDESLAELRTIHKVDQQI